MYLTIKKTGEKIAYLLVGEQKLTTGLYNFNNSGIFG